MEMDRRRMDGFLAKAQRSPRLRKDFSMEGFGGVLGGCLDEGGPLRIVRISRKGAKIAKVMQRF